MKIQGPSKLRRKIVDSIAREFDPQSHNLNSPHAPKEHASLPKLIITNLKSRYQLHFGGQFKGLLQARDQVLEHPFTFEYDLQEEGLLIQEESFMGSKFFREIKKNTKKFMVQSTSNVVSAGFKFLLSKDLEDKEAAQFASKNIMLNTQAIYRETVASLRDCPFLKDKVDIEAFRMSLILELDNILENILVNLADSYPQAPASGGSIRMREVINQVNRVEDEENDFIYASGIKISNYIEYNQFGNPQLRRDGDYTEFIMRVINAAIEVTQNNQEDFRERTVFQKFTQFNQHLFWAPQQKKYQQIMSSIEKSGQTEEVLAKLKKIICRRFDSILNGNEVNDEDGIEFGEEFQQLWAKFEDGIAQMKRNKQFALGQKIPALVKIFNRQEINANIFSAKHSSILRILTKWAEYLEDMFQNAQKIVRQRKYLFKNVQNQLLHLFEGHDGTDRLIDQLEKEYKEVKRKFDEIRINSFELIGKFLSEVPQEQFISSVNRYTQTRTVSSKINAVLTSLMLQYTNILIHHLLRAGKSIWAQDSTVHNINLVVFRVTDLMRSKMQCSQSGFINLLKTMYMLENNEAMKGKFKLVRIKNKLDDPANNIMINYLFMGKVQCQLQLSIQQPKGKQKDYYAFSHFVYELTRGKFGSIAECAIMISQLDPMITACKGAYYQQKKKTSNFRFKSAVENLQTTKIQQATPVSSVRFFECTQCNKLITKERTSKLLPKEKCKICYNCIIKGDVPQDALKLDLKNILQTVQKHQINNYLALRELKKQKFLVELTPTGQIKIYVVVYLQREMKTFSIEINQKIIHEILTSGIDFSSLDYIDISKKVKKSGKNPQSVSTLGYLFNDVVSISDNLLSLIGIKKQQLEQISKILEQFNEFRHEKNIIKAIKFKAEIIKTKGEEGRVLDKVCKSLVLNDSNDDALKLTYFKHKHLDLSNIKEISVPEANLIKIPKWIRRCQNLRKLQLPENQLQGQILGQELPQSLAFLDLNTNNLTKVDILTLHLHTLNLSTNKLIQFNMIDSLGVLDLKNNNLTSFDIGTNKFLASLDLSRNQLTTLNLLQNNTIIILSISHNSDTLEVTSLPPSIQELYVDGQAVVSCDFGPLIKLKSLWTYRQSASRGGMKGLSAGTTFTHCKY